MGADFGYQVLEIVALDDLLAFSNSQPEGETGIFGRSQDQAEPFPAVERSDEDILPRIEDLVSQGGRHTCQEEERDGDDEPFFHGRF